ncbi:TetR/AcrR family transcriptional regulator [Microbacterium sp. SCN 69-37]|uniref:TetR/AcrR family transcriptional regulator n=1 Tax=Microbacterium sp. SCN 69-37 TaxID=1660115 RepID=UPI0025ED4A04|nr:TetR/AcrR family transcriptional regulator [Microbacterium sp. SCN 69-37]
MNTEKRPYLPVEERRALLLDAAFEVVATDGAGALSLRAVAERAGVAHRVVSYAFGAKTELIAALLRRESARTMSQVWSAPLLGLSLQDAVAAALDALLADLRSNTARHRVVADLSASARSSDLTIDAARAEASDDLAAIAARLREWQDATSQPLPAPAPVVAAAVLAAANGLVDQWLALPDEPTAAATARLLSRAFTN